MSYVGDRILNAVVVIGFRHFRKQSSPFMWSFTDTEMGQRMNIEDTQGAVLAGLLRKAHIRLRCRDRFALAVRVHIGTSPGYDPGQRANGCSTHENWPIERDMASDKSARRIPRPEYQDLCVIGLTSDEHYPSAPIPVKRHCRLRWKARNQPG